MSACASCAREKRRCKLVTVTFPPMDAESCPAWLPWDDNAWLAHREQWYRQVDSVLNVENYLRSLFRTQERLASARMEVAAFQDDHHQPQSFATEDAARRWLQRVE
eukprot:11493295-Karenia_brevis.AAC.1